MVLWSGVNLSSSSLALRKELAVASKRSRTPIILVYYMRDGGNEEGK